MTTRAELVARWQAQLAASESHVASGAPRRQWLWQMRVRLYRFLLLCYGDGDWESDAPSTGNVSEVDGTHQRAAPTSQLVDNTASATGLAPKTAERIRATLKSVRVANDRVDAPGPYADGSYRLEWIRVASFKHVEEAETLVKELVAAGIESRRCQAGWQFVAIEVRRADFDAALALLAFIRPAITVSRSVGQAKKVAKSFLIQVVFFAAFGLGMIAIAVVDVIVQWPPNAPLNQTTLTQAMTLTHAIQATIGVACLGMCVVCLFSLWQFLARIHPNADPRLRIKSQI